jgi:hypothetical protein
MISLGLVLFFIGVLTGVLILKSLAIVLIFVGVVLLILGSMGRAVGGRRHYW